MTKQTDNGLTLTARQIQDLWSQVHGIVIDSKLDGIIAIVANEAEAIHFPACTCYTREEMAWLLKQGDANARKLHKMKRELGGFLHFRLRSVRRGPLHEP